MHGCVPVLVLLEFILSPAQKRHRGTASEGEARFRSGPGERGARTGRSAAGGEGAPGRRRNSLAPLGRGLGRKHPETGSRGPREPPPAASQDVRPSSISVSTGSVVAGVKFPKSRAYHSRQFGNNPVCWNRFIKIYFARTTNSADKD